MTGRQIFVFIFLSSADIKGFGLTYSSGCEDGNKRNWRY